MTTMPRFVRSLIIAVFVLAASFSGAIAAGPQSFFLAKHIIAAPATPTGVNASNSPAQVTVNWSAVSGATSYTLFYDTGTVTGSETGTGANSGVYTGLTGTSFTINGPLTGGATYNVALKAVNGGGSSPLSASASASASAVPTYPITFVVMGTSAPVSINNTIYTPTGSNLSVTWYVPLPHTFTFNILGAGGGCGDYQGYTDYGAGDGGGSSAVGLSPLVSGSNTGVLAIAGGGSGGVDYSMDIGGPGGNGNGSGGEPGFGAGYGGTYGSYGVYGYFSGFAFIGGANNDKGGCQSSIGESGGANAGVIAGTYTVTTPKTIYLGAGVGGASDGGDPDGDDGWVAVK